jgi:hypothetical protein
MCVTLRPTVIYFLGHPQTQNRPFKFQKPSQLFVCTHNEPVTVVPVRVSNPDRSSIGLIAETQPQLQPNLLSLSAMISKYFKRAPREMLRLGWRQISGFPKSEGLIRAYQDPADLVRSHPRTIRERRADKVRSSVRFPRGCGRTEGRYSPYSL